MRWEVPRELLWAIIFSLVVMLAAIAPSKYPFNQTPYVNAKRQTEDSVSSQHGAQNAPAPQIDYRREQEGEHGREQATEITILGIKPGEWLLGIVTWMLWVATVNLVRGSEKTAQQQLRAFVFAKGFSSIPNLEGPPDNPRVAEYWFFFTSENVGLTPAQELRSYFRSEILPKNEDVEPHFEPDRNFGAAIVLGPRSPGRSGYIIIDVDDLVRCWRNELEIYLWSRLEYRDILNPEILHHHEQCARLQFIHDPSELPPSIDHPSYVVFNMYGPQNTSS